MRPLIGHKIMKFFAQIVAAVTAEIEISVPRALSEFTLFDPVIGIVAETTITICCPACATEESTWSTFQGFHKATSIGKVRTLDLSLFSNHLQVFGSI